VDDLRRSLQARRDLLVGGLNDLGLETYQPAGTYFTVSDVRSLGYTDAVGFCKDLPRRTGVVAIPCSPFYDRHRLQHENPGGSLVRWTFSKAEATLAQALERMERGLGRPPGVGSV
jgi:N-succinyldiaminopimelate aminotransferase